MKIWMFILVYATHELPAWGPDGPLVTDVKHLQKQHGPCAIMHFIIQLLMAALLQIHC